MDKFKLSISKFLQQSFKKKKFLKKSITQNTNALIMVTNRFIENSGFLILWKIELGTFLFWGNIGEDDLPKRRKEKTHI